MSQIINELATIDVSNEVLQQMDLGGIYKSFRNNYQKLDDLKNFRSDYEKNNKLMRWWHNDKLRDAQLDSAEVQAEFSKTIGQLMMISIMQSKKLTEQQTQLNEQQGKLKTQADGIAEHAGELQKQHRVLAEQAGKLDELVKGFFEHKGFTKEQVAKFIFIANEIKSTKEGMLQDFAIRTKDVEALCSDVKSQMSSLSGQVNNQLQRSVEQVQAEMAAQESKLQKQQETSQQAMSQKMAQLEKGQQETTACVLTKQVELASSLSNLSENFAQQVEAHTDKFRLLEADVNTQTLQATSIGNEVDVLKNGVKSFIQQHQLLRQDLVSHQNQTFARFKHWGYVTVGLSVVVLGILTGMAYQLKWI